MQTGTEVVSFSGFEMALALRIYTKNSN
uniref:Uncharacterized protein n=1 Tax=Rhizophora mucronata TaxID=61149 RepID=A0A2P2PDZ4_RHIMU